MAQAKEINYTPEMEQILVAEYAGDKKTPETIAALSVKIGRSTRSIIAKLSRMGLYVKTSGYVRKDGTTPESKEQLADSIAALVGIKDEASASSLAKSNRSALAAIMAKLMDFEAFKKAALEAVQPEEAESEAV